MSYIDQRITEHHQNELRSFAEHERKAKPYRIERAQNQQRAIRQAVGRALIKLGESLQADEETLMPLRREA